MLDRHPGHLAYHEANVVAGRMAGEVRLRTRYRRLTTVRPFVDVDARAHSHRATKWKADHTDNMPGPNFAVVLERADAS